MSTNDYVSHRVFDGIRPLSKKKQDLILNKLLTDEQIVQGLLAHAPHAGDSAYVVRLAARRIQAGPQSTQR